MEHHRERLRSTLRELLAKFLVYFTRLEKYAEAIEESLRDLLEVFCNLFQFSMEKSKNRLIIILKIESFFVMGEPFLTTTTSETKA